MNALKEKIVEKLEHLPAKELQAVLDFVDFLAWRKVNHEDRLLSEEPLLRVAGILSGEPLTSHEIEEELYGDR